jgi:DNA-directed RNA polymerase subunit delta
MTVREMSLDELELLSYTDIAYELLKLDKKTMTTPELFGEVCKLLEISEDVMFDLIGDFYTNLTTDKRFLLLEDAKWDLKEFHSVKLVVEDDEEEEEETEESEDEELEEGNEDDAVEEDNEDYDDLDDDMDDLEDLVIVTEDELEE